MSVGDSWESLERTVCLSMWERGGGKKEKKFTYMEGELAAGVIGIYEYACWALHIRWGGWRVRIFLWESNWNLYLLYGWFLGFEVFVHNMSLGQLWPPGKWMPVLEWVCMCGGMGRLRHSSPNEKVETLELQSGDKKLGPRAILHKNRVLYEPFNPPQHIQLFQFRPN